MELNSLGALSAASTLAGVHFEATQQIAMKICLWSRLANRILLPLVTFTLESKDDLYKNARDINWSEHFTVTQSFAIDFQGTSEVINHSQFGAQVVKDGVVDYFRDLCGERPNVDLQNPDYVLRVHLRNGQCTIAFDFSGGSLHQRQYRKEQHEAPLKENLAAALLIKCDWPNIAKQGGALLDPMCGAGAILIEGALMAANIAPGLFRTQFGFQRWKSFQPLVWKALLKEAQEAQDNASSLKIQCFGWDEDGHAIHQARVNAETADCTKWIQVKKRPLQKFTLPEELGSTKGLLLTNPPYGERLGDLAQLPELYRSLGDILKTNCPGWRAAILTGNPEMGKEMRLKAFKQNLFFNGPLECKLLQFEIRELSDPRLRRPSEAPGSKEVNAEFVSSALANRLKKNWQALQKWSKKESVSCFRLYDADLPEYSAAIDVYDTWLHVQEYVAPKEIPEEKAQRRLLEILHTLPTVLPFDAQHIVLKQRKRQKGKAQYVKQDERKELLEVMENDCRYLVNLHDYIDTGLFLDHRLVRKWIIDHASGKNFLNLFCYTGSATVAAVKGGSKKTTSLDLSWTYLDWAKRNLMNNGFNLDRNHFIEADCQEWLKQPTARGFDLIFCDPPTFSNSKKMEGFLDVQVDHLGIIEQCLALLAPQGELLFSSNFQKFKLAPSISQDYLVENLTAATLPFDFKRSPKIHQVYLIKRRA